MTLITKLSQFINALFSCNTHVVDVSKELSQLKQTKARLELSKKQQAEIIAEAECNKLHNEVEMQEIIREIQAEYAESNKEEDAAIENSEDIIEDVDQWLAMFPTKK